MKKLIIINGTMGVGKTTVCKELHQRLDKVVWLDGDWCWMMHPWVFSEENKVMVMKNIHFLLNSYLKNSGFDYVIFSWVIHLEEIMAAILQGITEQYDRLYKFTLVCAPEALKERMRKDGRANTQASLERLDMYKLMDTVKVDTTNREVGEIVDAILALIDQDLWKIK